MSSEAWESKSFAEFVEINPRRVLIADQQVKFVEMARLSTTGAKIAGFELRPIMTGGSKFQNGDTLFARITPCTENGKIGFVDFLDESEFGQGSTEFIVFGPKDGISDPHYIYQLTRSDLVRAPAIRSMIGTTGRQRVSNWAFDQIEIRVPPLPEQRRIAEILMSVDEAIAATEALIEQTKRVKQGVLRKLLTRGIGHTRFKQTEIGEIPEGWEVAPLGTIATFQPGFAFKSAEFVDDGDKLLRGSNVGVETTDWADEITRFFPRERRKEFEEYVLEVGDIIIAMDRPFVADGFKVVRLKETDLPALLLQRVGRFLPTKRCDPDWLWQVVSAGTLRIHLEQHQVGTDLPHISRSDIEKCAVAIPPVDEQRGIANHVIDMDRTVEVERHRLRVMKRLKSALMSDLLTGRKRVTLPSESAAA